MNKNIKEHSKQGGFARAKSMSPQERSESARTASKARWKKYRLIKNHVCDRYCICDVCGRIKTKGAHTKFSGDGRHEFVCSINHKHQSL